MRLPIVAIIGRPNVGKSSLFNRFLRKKIAIVDDRPGITRDRNYAVCEWQGRRFYLIDTGGMLPGTKVDMEKMILSQAETAVEQADLILLVVDAQTGIDKTDSRIAAGLLKSGRKTLLLANKCDSPLQESEIFQFLKLGLGEPMPISATGGRGIGDTLDRIVSLLPEELDSEIADEPIRLAIIGRPNVGKSSFVNRLLGEERAIVSPQPGTTRDAVDTPFEFEGRKYVLTDTAGLRRKSKVTDDLEYYTTLRTLRALESSHIAVLLLDASQGLLAQDIQILEDAVEASRGIILVVNKWDLVEKDSKTADRITLSIKKTIATRAYIPVVFISSLSGQRITKVLSLADKAFANWGRQVATSDFNKALEELVAKQPPAAAKGKYIKFYYGLQVGVRPPSFQLFCNYPELLMKSYLRYIENQLRARIDFEGTPLRISLRKRK